MTDLMMRVGVAAGGLVVGTASGFLLGYAPETTGLDAAPGTEAPARPSPRPLPKVVLPEPCPPLTPEPALEALTREIEGIQGELSDVEEDIATLVGEASSFDGLPPERQPLAMEDRLIEVLDELGRGEIYYTDCSEQPCIAVLEVVIPSFDKEHFGVFTEAVQGAFGTEDLDFWAASSGDAEEGGALVHLALPLDHTNGAEENTSRNQHRADQLLWDADADVRENR